MRLIRKGPAVVAVLFIIFSSQVSALAVWDAVQATGPLNVRSSPSLSGSIVTEIPPTSKGILLVGPSTSDGYTWWYINWESGVSGYSADINLVYLAPTPSVYSDKLGLGWRENGWANTTSNFLSTTSKVGSYSVETTTTSTSGRLYLRTNAISTSGYNSLRFSVRNHNSNGQILYVGLYNTSGVALRSLAIWDYVSGGTLSPNTWYDVRIPITDLNAPNQTIGGVVIESAQAATFYVDDLALDPVSGSTIWNPPPPTPTPTPPTPAPPPPPPVSQAGSIVYILLHGTASDRKTWDDLVRARFANDCPTTRVGEAIPKESICYRHKFEDEPLTTAGIRWRNGDAKTFTQLGEEVADIVDKITERLHPSAIVLVGHSRGGLAARAYLQDITVQPAIKLGLLTIGTPHQGTPLGRAQHWLLDKGYIPETFEASLRAWFLCKRALYPSYCRYKVTSLLFSPSVGYQATEHDDSGNSIRTPISIAIWQLNDGADRLGRWLSTIGQIDSSRLRLGENTIYRYDLLSNPVVASGLRGIFVPGAFRKMRRFILLNIGAIKIVGLTDSWTCKTTHADDWACNGDGIVPTISQQLTNVPGISIGGIPWHRKPLSRVSHAVVSGRNKGETGQVPAINEVLNLMIEDLLRR